MKSYYELQDGRVVESRFNDLEVGDPYQGSKISGPTTKSEYELQQAEVRANVKFANRVNRSRRQLENKQVDMILAASCAAAIADLGMDPAIGKQAVTNIDPKVGKYL